jgi:hypothetical protein
VATTYSKRKIENWGLTKAPSHDIIKKNEGDNYNG